MIQCGSLAEQQLGRFRKTDLPTLPPTFRSKETSTSHLHKSIFMHIFELVYINPHTTCCLFSPLTLHIHPTTHLFYPYTFNHHWLKLTTCQVASCPQKIFVSLEAFILEMGVAAGRGRYWFSLVWEEANSKMWEVEENRSSTMKWRGSTYEGNEAAPISACRSGVIGGRRQQKQQQHKMGT